MWSASYADVTAVRGYLGEDDIFPPNTRVIRLNYIYRWLFLDDAQLRHVFRRAFPLHPLYSVSHIAAIDAEKTALLPQKSILEHDS